MALSMEEIQVGSLVRLSRDIEGPAGVLPRGAIFVVSEISAGGVLGRNQYQEYNLPPSCLETS